jgi:cytoskeletal protein CcmA (bactofilin family)
LSSTGPAARNRTSAPAGNGSDGNHSSVVLGPRDRLVGLLYVEGDVRVVGTVEGELEVTGSVEIDDGGRVTGPVTAHDRLVVGRAGSLKGDVRVARLVVQDGATFIGNVSMGKAALAAPPKPVEAVKPPDAIKPVEAVEPPQAVETVDAAKLPEAVKTPEPAKAQEPVKAAQPVKRDALRAAPVLPIQATKPPDRKTKPPDRKRR